MREGCCEGDEEDASQSHNLNLLAARLHLWLDPLETILREYHLTSIYLSIQMYPADASSTYAV